MNAAKSTELTRALTMVALASLVIVMNQTAKVAEEGLDSWWGWASLLAAVIWVVIGVRALLHLGAAKQRLERNQAHTRFLAGDPDA